MFESLDKELQCMVRLLNRVEPNERGCWIFKGAKNYKGYGLIGIRASRCHAAHRVSYHIFKEPIPKGMHILHSCDVPACVNPEHLWVGTNQDNMDDMVRKRRSPGADRTHCRQGHEFTPENTGTRWDNGHRECRRCRADIKMQNYYRSYEKNKERQRMKYRERVGKKSSVNSANH